MKNVPLVLITRPLTRRVAFPKRAISRPADNLVTDNIPEIPASLVEKVARYTEFRSAGLWTGIRRSGDARDHALRRHVASSSRQVPRRRSHADDLLSRQCRWGDL